MELSAVVKESGLTLTRAEGKLLSQLPAGGTTRFDDLYGQRMKDLAAGQEALNQVPNRQTTVRQRQMEKAAMLKERLKVLKQMIPFLSPSAARSLKAEMRQIAAQLASLDAGSGGGTGGGATAADAPVLDPSGSNTKFSASPETAQPSEAGEGSNGQQPKQQDPAESVVLGTESKRGDSTSGDRQLKETVEDLKNLYKAVLAALKRKQLSSRDTGQPAISPQLKAYAAMPDTTNRLAFKV